MKNLIYGLIFILCLGEGCNTFLTGDCDNTIKSEAKSPDGKYIVSLYIRDCGATTDFSTMVNLRLSSSKFNGDKDPIFIVKGQPNITVTWIDKTNLQIKCAESDLTDSFRQDKLWQDIKISYQIHNY